MSKIGFIGGGNMATAIIDGIIGSDLYAPENIFVYTQSQTSAKRLNQRYATAVAKDLAALCAVCDILVLAVKPGVLPGVLEQLSPLLAQSEAKPLCISIVAGVSTGALQDALGEATPVVRVMPNTPAMVGAGMSAISAQTRADAAQMQTVCDIFEALGRVCRVAEKDMDAVTGVSGSGPAYAYLFIEAMADAGVLEGLPRDTSYLLAAQTLLGAAKMVLETGEHPGVLKDRVCSPGGTTICAVQALEQGGLRATVMDAVCRCTRKSRDLGKA